MSKVIFNLILVCVVTLLTILMISAWWGMRSVEPLITPIEEVELDEESDTESDADVLTSNLFEIDPGVRATYASNPLVVEQTEETLLLAYEYRSPELKNAPTDRVRFMRTEDGLNFEDEGENDDSWQAKPEPLLLSDGTYRRYFYSPVEGGVMSEVSQDGKTFILEEGLRYELAGDGVNDPHVFGVSTYFVDSQGGVVLLYNRTNDMGDVVVNQAYATPESEGMEFTLIGENILGGSLETDYYADPHTVVLENGNIWLVVMYQTDGAKPPVGKQGIIYGYVSEDDGKTFTLMGRLFDYDDFDALSLNDPKMVAFPDGTLRVYVAAMVADETADNGYRWDLVSAHN